MKRTVEVDVKPEPREMAEAFWNFDDTQMADFFNHLSIVDDWKFAVQLQYLTDNAHLTSEGRDVMRTIGDYSGKPA